MVAAVYLVVVTPVLGFYDQRQATIEQRRALEPRLRATAATVLTLRSQLATLREGASTRKVVLDGASDAIASANLQSRIEELAAASGVSLSSTEGLPAEARGLHRRIGLRIAINGPYEGIVHLLAAIEAATPPLVLDNLQIRGTMQARLPRSVLVPQRGMQQIDPPSNPRLDAGCEVYGFRSNDAPVALKQ